MATKICCSIVSKWHLIISGIEQVWKDFVENCLKTQ